jgi:hypothetical protein
MQSENYRVLCAALDRYAAGELAGQSFLISGHRGAGKTTLVTRAVQDCNDTAFGERVRHASDRTASDEEKLRELGLRRLLLVKLHGPSLVAVPEAARDKPSEEKTPDGEKASLESGPGEAARKPPAGEKALALITVALERALAGEPKPADDAKSRMAQNALKQITLALFRAMADEFALCYAYQAAPSDAAANSASHPATAAPIDPAAAERLYELAGQFRLDLDQSARPEALREYWDAVGCLHRGILWPQLIGDFADKAGLHDQGTREIQALATAGQAFQVCSGAIVHRETVKDVKAQEQTREAKLGIDLANALNRAIGLAVGGVLGYGAAGAVGAAVGVGIVAASGLWTSRRSRKQEESLDYTFIRDFSLQTLERDLPLVIDRVRAAGLAPVFVVDELDKVEGPGLDIGELIGQLKHLTTDYGFYCFLTGRDYYEDIEQKIAERIYPREHTNFSERLFVVYTPSELADFLGRTIVMESTSPNEEGYDELARAMLVRIVLHRSKLNTIDAMRELARWSARRELAESSEEFTSNIGHQATVAMQLAVECRLAQGEFATKVGRASLVLQVMIDEVYRVSRIWEANDKDFALSEEAFAESLIKRFKPGQKPNKSEIRSIKERRYGAIGFRDLWRISKIDDLLLNLAEVSQWATTHLTASEQKLLGPIPFGLGQAIRQTADPDRFEFVFDVFGRYT